MPVEVTSFVGRRREMAESRRLLASSRLVTFTGVGGVGKTRLALRVASEVGRAFADGTWLVELAGLRDAGLLAQTVAAALGIQEQSARWPLVRLSEYLADRQLLLVLDNCEHLLDACAMLADALLRTCPRLRILATSRQALGIAGESILLVPPLSVPDPDRPLPPAEALTRYEAARLFAERAAAVLPGFAITASNAAAVARICQRLDGIPLAIELAAVRLQALSVDQLLARLDDRYRLLTNGSRAALPRQQTLRAMIDWSFDLCSAQERALWARASVFAESFDLEASETVCSGDDLPRESVFDLVAGLVEKSILLREEHPSGVRYRLLETIRQYGRERLAESGGEEAVLRRHRDYYLHRVEQVAAAWFGPDQEAWLARLRLEHANLRAALEFCLTEPGEAEAGLRIAASLWFYWIATGLLSEGRRWLDLALELETRPSTARAVALWVDAYLAILQSDIPPALPLLRDSQALAERLGDPVALAWSTQVAGMAAMFTDELANAATLLEDALARHRANDDRIGTLDTLFYLASVASMLGDAERAAALCEESLAICETHGECWFNSYMLWVFSLTAWRQGDRGRAFALAQASLRKTRALSERLVIALDIEVLAWTAAADGNYQRAAYLLGAAQPIWQAMGASPFWDLADHHRACETSTRRALDEKTFQAAFRHGAELTLDQAIAYALEEKAVSARPSAPGDPAAALTRREWEIAELIAEGLSNREIATKLVIAQRTAENHVEHILTKLGFTSRTQIAAWVAEHRAASTTCTGQ